LLRVRFLFVVTLFIFFDLCIEVSSVHSQSITPETTNYRYWIYFKDKGKFKKDDPIDSGSEVYKAAMSELSDKAIWRRSKVLPPDQIVSYEDLPVNPEYVDKIKSLGILPKAISKWFNAVSIIGNKKDLDAIKKLGIVEKIEGVHFLEYEESDAKKTQVNVTVPDNGSYKYNYGPSFWQEDQISVPVLHNYGVTGFGVTVGMCDDGFNWRKHEALKGRNVMAEYDWINKDDSVQNQHPPNQIPGDAPDQDEHGTSTFSTLGGFKEGKLIGPAFDADFYLSKTEVSPTETPVEEDFWLEGAEWMESKGIEVLSSSLIYKPFDFPNDSYDYNDMNGHTTVIARACERLVHLGVVVCNAAGNEFQTDPPSIVSPADVDSVISVGAVDSAGSIAMFSSNGPTSTGIMKPDVVAMGVDDYVALSHSVSRNDTTYLNESGTSFATPLTAGVCALILSAHPELTPMQVKESLKNTADKKSTPNNIYGWGLINALNAVLYNGMFMSNKPELKIDNDNLSASIYVISKNVIDMSSVKMFYSVGGSQEFKEAPMDLIQRIDEHNSAKYSVSIPVGVNFDVVKFYFSASDAEKNMSEPYNAPAHFYYMNSETKELQIF